MNFYSASTKTECGTFPNWDEPSKGCQDRLQLLAVGVGPGTDAAGLVSGSDGRKEGADVGRGAAAPPHAPLPPLLDLPLKRRSCSCRQPPQCSVLGGKKCAACRSAVQNRPRHSNATLLQCSIATLLASTFVSVVRGRSSKQGIRMFGVLNILLVANLEAKSLQLSLC